MSFDQFWDSLPTKRRNNRKGCSEKWKQKKLDEQYPAISEWVRRMKNTQEWKNGYNPAPMTIINQERWRDGVPEEVQKLFDRGRTPQYGPAMKPEELVEWVKKNKPLSTTQIRSPWRWVLEGGCIKGVVIPCDGDYPSYRVMYGDVM